MEKIVKLFNFCIASCALTIKKMARKLRCMRAVMKNSLRDLLCAQFFSSKYSGHNSSIKQNFFCTQVASIPTAHLFPDGFPSDFSILATFRAESQSKEMLFTIYNLEGKEVMSLKIGRRVKLYYQVKMPL